MDKDNKIKKLLLIGNAEGLHLQTWSNILFEANIDHIVYSPVKSNLKYRTEIFYPEKKSSTSPLFYYRLSRIARRYAHVNLHMPVFKMILLFFMPANTVWVNIWGSELLLLPKKYPLFKFLLKKALGRAKGIIVPNQYTKHATQKLIGNDIPVKIIPYPVDSNRFSPNNKQNRNLTIILPKEIAPIYGTDIMLQAWIELYRQFNGKLILTGKNKLPDNWKKIVENVPSQSIIMPGFVDNIQDYYAQSHITVIPSRSESFGIVALESILMQIPVIASDIGGLKYIIKETGGGITVPPESSEAIIKAVEEIWNNYDEWKEKMIYARKIVMEKYSMKNIVKEVKSIW